MQKFNPTGALSPCGTIKGENVFHSRDVNDHTLKMMKTGDFYTGHAKNMKTDYEAAAEIAEQAVSMFDRSLDRLMKSQDRITEQTKQVSGKLRDTNQKLSDGLARIEKLANFDRLERYVVLLERAESAMSALAELEKSGKLDKITAAMR